MLAISVGSREREVRLEGCRAASHHRAPNSAGWRLWGDAVVAVVEHKTLLPTDTKPAGVRFVATPTGDKRVAVYACTEHNKTQGEPVLKQRANRT